MAGGEFARPKCNGGLQNSPWKGEGGEGEGNRPLHLRRARPRPITSVKGACVSAGMQAPLL